MATDPITRAASADAGPLQLTRSAADSVPVEAIGLDAWEAHAVPRPDEDFDRDALMALLPHLAGLCVG